MSASIKRPVWLFSMDSEQFHAAPTTTASLLAFHQRYGKDQSVDIKLVHLKDDAAIEAWLADWRLSGQQQASAALAAGVQPIAGFSVYTWNAAEFLELLGELKNDCPDLLTIAGGPHVQQAEDYLGHDPFDLIVLGEGEHTFQQLLDNPAAENWPAIPGLAWLEQGEIRRSGERSRVQDLNTLPSPLDVLSLVDDNGEALYDAISYETSRGCPFKCAFCEWGTGAIGTRMYQFSMERIERDWRSIAAAGIKDIWLADSNFGALKEDLKKAELVCALKRDTGFPVTFATSWSKKHSPRVQQIVTLLHKNGLLPHYQLALQTLTPEALRLSNRQNMQANKYTPIAKQMAEEGIPIAAELIWGLPGDNLPDFERNLDLLLSQFPNVNIFGYTLLPGTEFYRRRDEYRIETIPVAGYGKAKGEYVIACHSFDRTQGLAGYFMISAHILLVHGHLMPLTTRYLALSGMAPVSVTLRALLTAVVDDFATELPDIHSHDAMSVYENRAALYLEMLQDPERLYAVMQQALQQQLRNHQVRPAECARIASLLELDADLAPRTGSRQQFSRQYDFAADSVINSLQRMEKPLWSSTASTVVLDIESPGGVGSILKDPDGGGWLKAEYSARKTSAVQVISMAELNT